MHEDMSGKSANPHKVDVKVLAEALGPFVDKPHFINYADDRKITKANVDRMYLLLDGSQALIATVKQLMPNMCTGQGVWTQALLLINKDS